MEARGSRRPGRLRGKETPKWGDSVQGVLPCRQTEKQGGRLRVRPSSGSAALLSVLWSGPAQWEGIVRKTVALSMCRGLDCSSSSPGTGRPFQAGASKHQNLVAA